MDMTLRITLILEIITKMELKLALVLKTELVSLISKAHSENIQVYADIVLNHNSGGQLENNPYTEIKPTQTLPV
jgi:hypothetical protein